VANAYRLIYPAGIELCFLDLETPKLAWQGAPK